MKRRSRTGQDGSRGSTEAPAAGRRRQPEDYPPPAGEPFERTPDGFVNNCALRAGEDEEKCQVCRGVCPDKRKAIDLARPSPGETFDEAGARVRRWTSEVLRGAVLDDGDEVSWTAGKELFCPIKFHAFEVGPVTVTTRVRPRETARAALARAKGLADAAWAAEYEEKLTAHLERVRRAAGTARS